MPKRPVQISLWWLGGLACTLIIILLAAMNLAAGGLTASAKVGVVEVTGLLSRPERTVEQLVEFARDDSIKAIIVRIDSPGGGVAAAQEIHREVVRARAKKKVVASLGGVAASGGYYIAVGADRIVANPGTTTGSIGVIVEMGNIEELLDKIGVRFFSLKSGRFKDAGSPARPLTDEDRAMIQAVIDDMHGQFVAAVAEGRNLAPDKVRAIADGRILSGRQALDLGLVDELGNFRDAVALAGKLGGIEGDPEVVYAGRERPGLLAELIRDAFEEAASMLGLVGPRIFYRP